MKWLVLRLIRLYQHTPHLSSCRFSPSCSEYSYQAIAKYGIIAGFYLSLKRVLSCHPFNRGGFDPLT